MTAEHVQASLRELTRRMVEGAPYEELTQALDALRAMPGADELRGAIAGRYLALLTVYDQDDAERTRIIARVMPDLDVVPLTERVDWIVGAGREPDVVAPFLAPLRPAIDAAAAQAPDDVASVRARWLASVYLDEDPEPYPWQPTTEPQPAEPPPFEGEDRDELAPGWTPTWPEHVARGLEVVRRLIVAHRSYEELSEALDAVLELPDGEQAAGVVANYRLTFVINHERDDVEAERVLEQVAPVLATFTPIERASSLVSLYTDRPAVAARHLPAVVADLERELAERPAETWVPRFPLDTRDEAERLLALARRLLTTTVPPVKKP